MKFLAYSFNIVFLLSLLTTPAQGKLRDPQTTRLIANSGTGIGSILLNEAAVLNPASIYFFSESSFYYQQTQAQLSNQATTRNPEYDDGLGQLYIITDTSSALKGTLSYQTQSENHEQRKRFTSSASANLGKNASFGVLYRYTEDSGEENETYHQAVFGITYIYSSKLVLGATLTDPFLSNKEDTSLAAGFQYTLSQNFLILADAGGNYKEDIEQDNFWRTALQAQFFGDFFLRAGKFEDNGNGLRGDSWGISWIGPRLALEYAFKNSEAFRSTSSYLKGEELAEHSLALWVVIK